MNKTNAYELKDFILRRMENKYEYYIEDTLSALYEIEAEDIMQDVIDAHELDELSEYGIKVDENNNSIDMTDSFWTIFEEARDMAEDEIEERYEDWAYQDEFETETMYY